LRSDDDPEKLKRRVEIYHEQTAPLVDYYRLEGALTSVDGMASIPEVASAIDQALGGASQGRPKAAARRQTEKKAAPKKVAPKRAAARKAPAKSARTSAKSASKAAVKGPAKTAKRGVKAARSGARTGKAAAKTAAKTTKSRRTASR
jgi:adenylate kinase